MLSPHLARIRSFEVVPKLPTELGPLLDIAQNLWWTWHPQAMGLFKRVDPVLWEASHHNPVQLLGHCQQERLTELAGDEGFLSELSHVQKHLARDRSRPTWLAQRGIDVGDATIAYFCAEFGLAQCLQIYSGGLGCLAGDHLKSASELGLPLVGVGLLYRHGYFQQYLNADGWQQEYYDDLDFANLPIEPVKDDQNQQIQVQVDLPGRALHIALWKVKVGRIDLYLLDTNVKQNNEEDRQITGHLYGGDMEMRIKQEIVLGIGGVRALGACGIEPRICHMNEGHSAFLALERISQLIQRYDVSFDQARAYAKASHLFTTHTPVPAGIDRFAPEFIERYFKAYVSGLKLNMGGLLSLGRENVFSQTEYFSMAVLALRTAGACNAVSALHGVVSRSMWQNIWPGMPDHEVPIGHVTNGVHARSWLSSELIQLLDGYLGPSWQDNPADQSGWEQINHVPDEELWRIHENGRRRLILWARKQIHKQALSRGSDLAQVEMAASVLDPGALTVGFARRFATYKRGNLLLRDPDRLMKLINCADRPIQFVIAGKAHPADSSGKELIKQMVHFARDHNVGHRIVFLENYDINVARYLVQGCDVWLNTPRRGMEASGTSGMKAALNGGLNLSILDGWWDEAYETDLGWAIGKGEHYADHDQQDDIESKALYELLEKQIVPLFYNRNEMGLPTGWLQRMKCCISKLAPRFNTNRMVKDYVDLYYLPALRRTNWLGANKLQKAVQQANQEERLRQNWGQIQVKQVQVDTPDAIAVGEQLHLDVTVQLGQLSPEELHVEAYHGDLDNDGRIIRGQGQAMHHQSDLGQGNHRYQVAIGSQTSGRHGFAIRVLPGGATGGAERSGEVGGAGEAGGGKNEALARLAIPGMIYWDQQTQTSSHPSSEASQAVDDTKENGKVNGPTKAAG